MSKITEQDILNYIDNNFIYNENFSSYLQCKKTGKEIGVTKCGRKDKNGFYYCFKRRILPNQPKILLAHRVIFYLVNRFLPKSVDHIKHDLDEKGCYINNSSNLRESTNGQNKANSRKQRRKTTSIYKGVCLLENGKFRAKCKRKHIGDFVNEIDAAKAYDRKAIEYWGGYALTNF
jgi:hypothetical protein